MVVAQVLSDPVASVASITFLDGGTKEAALRVQQVLPPNGGPESWTVLD